MSTDLHNADCLDVLAALAPESIDAIVQDPPAGIAFMGRSWDDLSKYQPRTERGSEVHQGLDLLKFERWASGFVAFLVEVFVAELRVAKPGAHSLTWALPRTADLTTLALRLAGWEIRDSIVHLFGGGFPKSLDVGKAIDKQAGAKREVVGYTQGRSALHGGGQAVGAPDPVTAPATEAAKQWDGWHTALSPGHEQWILARKPMGSTVVACVLAHGTGAINVGATRTGAESRINPPAGNKRGGHAYMMAVDGMPEDAEGRAAAGRWPKNAILSCSLACEAGRHSPGCPVRELDRQSGTLTNGGQNATSSTRGIGHGTAYGEPGKSYAGDTGGASRFFPRFGYHPKASDRSVPGRADLENKHPTHKHPDLMRWLVRLVTPPSGVVFDAFMGSGTTGVAVIAEDCSFIGCERDPEHFAVARARILSAEASPEYAAEANAAAPVGAQLGLL
jgi:DNA modification methylase